MQPGRLNKRVQLQAPIATQDAFGQDVTTWDTPVTVWGSVEPVRGAEALRAGQVLADMDTRIRVRHSSLVSGVNAKWRAVHAGVIYNVVSVANNRLAGVELELMCKSGVNSG